MNEVFTADERLHIGRAKDIIRKELRLHFEALPIKYYELFKTSILTGGAIGSILRDDNPNDWDMYLEQSQADKFLDWVTKNAENIQDCILEMPHKYHSSHVQGKYVTAYATTFKNKLQVITGFNKDHRLEFDFVHCMPYFDMKTQKLHISKQQYKACMEKMLIKNERVQKAPGEMWTPKKRLEKFLDNGWRLDIR
jgi:hypothetical protein